MENSVNNCNQLSLKDSKEEQVMHSGSDNIKFTTFSGANYVIENVFDSFCSKYQDGIETSMK